MPEVVYRTATSADGFIADERNSLDWLFEVPDDDADPAQWDGFIDRIGALVLGSTTYEWVLEHERLLERPDRWREFYGDRPAWVLTHRALAGIPGADVRFVQGDVAELHERVVRSAGGRDVWVVGGGDVAGQYADAGLLDRILLDVTPVFLGDGAPVLPRRIGADRLRVEAAARDGQRVRIELAVGAPARSVSR